MKKVLLLLFVLLVIFVIYSRNRLYLRDPMGSVVRNGVKEYGTQVFIDYANDVLLENDHPPMYVTIVQPNDHIGLPAELKCVHFFVCLADKDVATLIGNTGEHVETMSSKTVTYRDSKKREVVVTLH